VDLNKAFGTDRLLATSGEVDIWWVILKEWMLVLSSGSVDVSFELTKKQIGHSTASLYNMAFCIFIFSAWLGSFSMGLCILSLRLEALRGRDCWDTLGVGVAERDIDGCGFGKREVAVTCSGASGKPRMKVRTMYEKSIYPLSPFSIRCYLGKRVIVSL
jgi:hypothetical protein